MREVMLTIGAAVCIATAITPANAEQVHGDIGLYIENGKLTTGLVSEDGAQFIPSTRLFVAELGEDIANITAEPGWQAEDGAFTPRSVITFQINRALRKWNALDFSEIAGAMQLTFGPLLPVVSPSTDFVVDGFPLQTDSDGGLHDHPFYELLAPAAAGVYLLDISFAAPSQNISISDPVWILFGQNVSEDELNAAYEFAAATIPAPGVIPLLFAPVFLRRRR